MEVSFMTNIHFLTSQLFADNSTLTNLGTSVKELQVIGYLVWSIKTSRGKKDIKNISCSSLAVNERMNKDVENCQYKSLISRPINYSHRVSGLCQNSTTAIHPRKKKNLSFNVLNGFYKFSQIQVLSPDMKQCKRKRDRALKLNVPIINRRCVR